MWKYYDRVMSKVFLQQCRTTQTDVLETLIENCDALPTMVLFSFISSVEVEYVEL
jgi:hypothetical protein